MMVSTKRSESKQEINQEQILTQDLIMRQEQDLDKV